MRRCYVNLKTYSGFKIIEKEKSQMLSILNSLLKKDYGEIKIKHSNIYKIHPSVYEKADSAQLELIERAQEGNLSDEEYLQYETGIKTLEDYINFDEM